jgi:membrane associated rhomboid family serine protease
MMLTPWVTRLLVANVAAFFLTLTLPSAAYDLGLIGAIVLIKPWTVVTYMFLHASIGHLFFNMLALFFFGPPVESRLGGKRFLWLYFLSGLTGALLSIFFTPNVPIVGASGAIFGVQMAFALYWPRELILIWGVIPIEARWLVIITTVMSLWFARQGGGTTAHYAHLGGYLGGFLYLKWLERHSEAAKFKARAQPVGAPPKRTSSADVERWNRIERNKMHEINRAELDRILDKIAASGVASLTPDERAFLARFSGK